jgi:hypothetical protein
MAGESVRVCPGILFKIKILSGQRKGLISKRLTAKLRASERIVWHSLDASCSTSRSIERTPLTDTSAEAARVQARGIPRGDSAYSPIRVPRQIELPFSRDNRLSASTKKQEFLKTLLKHTCSTPYGISFCPSSWAESPSVPQAASDRNRDLNGGVTTVGRFVRKHRAQCGRWCG